jgi:hypothetical protein
MTSVGSVGIGLVLEYIPHLSIKQIWQPQHANEKNEESFSPRFFLDFKNEELFFISKLWFKAMAFHHASHPCRGFLAKEKVAFYDNSQFALVNALNTLLVLEGHSTFDNDQLFIDTAGILTIECGQTPRNCDSFIHIPNNHVAPQAIAEAICGRYQLRTPTDSDRQHFRSPEAILDFCQQMAIDESVGIVGVGRSLLDHLGRGEKKATEEDLCRNSGPDKDFMSPALGEFFRRATVVLNEATLGRPMNFDCI